MTSETKEAYPEVSSFSTPVPTYTQTSSPPPQGGVYNKAAEAYQQPTVDPYQHTGVTERMASPLPQQNFQQPQPLSQNSYHMQHQGSYQSQPGQPQPQMQHINSSGSVPQQQQQFQSEVRPFQTAYPLASLSSSAAPVDCPACGKRAMTKIHYTSGNTTNAWALGVCLLTCLGCFAYLFNGIKDVVHQCSQCGVELAVWHRSGRTEVKRH